MFSEIFHTKYTSKYFSPGRINILGEHIDYNGGLCLPMAIKKGTMAYASRREDKKFAIYSKNFSKEGIYEIDIFKTQEKKKEYGWSNLFRGMLKVLEKKLSNIEKGLNIYFDGEIPTGSGLSSSASISMLIGKVLDDQYNLNLSTLDLVFLTQKMENDFLGAKTGIMDQYAIGYGKEKNVMLLDTSKPSHSYFVEDFGNYQFLIVSTNKTRELADSKYNTRVKECQMSLKKLQENGFEIKHLCDISIDKLEKVKQVLNDDILFKRVRHCITEQNRVISATKVLKDVQSLGNLLFEGHESLRDDYEVTGEHLDFIYDFSKKFPSAIGARMTGAGFGGSGIVLLPKNDIEKFKKDFLFQYKAKFNIEPSFLIADSSEGTHKC